MRPSVKFAHRAPCNFLSDCCTPLAIRARPQFDPQLCSIAHKASAVQLLIVSSDDSDAFES